MAKKPLPHTLPTIVHHLAANGSEEYRLSGTNTLIAIVISAPRTQTGLDFPSSAAEEFQIGHMLWPVGHEIQSHSHKPIKRTIHSTSEVLFVRRGRVLMSLFTQDGIHLTDRELSEGDVVALFAGGHGFTILEDAEIVEVKQGPYTGEDEKTRFHGRIQGPDDAGK